MINSKLVLERQQAIHLLRSGRTIKEVAEILNRHENWVRKWWKRYQSEGWSSLEGQSKAPKKHGRKLSETIQQAIRQARSELEAEATIGDGLKYIGALAVRTKLKEKGIEPIPSRSSIERVLKKFDMTKQKRQEENDPILYPHLKPIKPHQLCQVDIVPHFLTGGERVACFNAIDIVSRYPTGQPFSQRRSQDAAEFLIHVWQEIGIPHYTQLDNEGCFSGGATHPNVLGKVVRLALQIGTELVFSPFYHPKSNGTVERFHQDYNTHVWQHTYLRHQEDVRNRSITFFALYRESHHHKALNGYCPNQIHFQQPPTKLSPDFVLSTNKLPLHEGQIHFIRKIEPDGNVKVLNSFWKVPKPDFQKGVWVTITFKQTGAILTIYNAAPNYSDRQSLISYPFPINETVLSHPTKTLQPSAINSNTSSDTNYQSTSNGMINLWGTFLNSTIRVATDFLNTIY